MGVWLAERKTSALTLAIPPQAGEANSTNFEMKPATLHTDSIAIGAKQSPHNEMKYHHSYFLFLLLPVLITGLYSCTNSSGNIKPTETTEPLWRGWNKYQIPESDSLARYGRELIEHTSHYLGPKGTVAQITNGMNCQNCHL